MKVLLPGMKFKVNSCNYKLIRLLKMMQEWKINTSVCFSPLLELFCLPYFKVLLWPMVRAVKKSRQDVNTGGLPCTGTVSLCNFKYILMDTNLYQRVLIQLHPLLQSMKQYNVMDDVACKHDTEAMLSEEKYWKTAQFIFKDYTKQRVSDLTPVQCLICLLVIEWYLTQYK